MNYHCIGDSHIGVLDKNVHGDKCDYDLSNFFMCPIGPVLAYNFIEGSISYETAKSIIERIDLRESVILSLGEIDMRCHVLKQRDKIGCSIPEIVEEIAERYIKSVDKLCSLGRKIYLLAPGPTGNYDNDSTFDSNFPFYGLYMLRNLATIEFNKILIYKYKLTISIIDSILDDDFSSDNTFFRDSIHLNEKAVPIILNKLSELEGRK